ncbi:MAG: hypothetical protein ABI693_13920 [Bryobacteraceae bacterium]
MPLAIAAACLLAIASVGPIEKLIEGLLDPDPAPAPSAVFPLAIAALLAHAGLLAGVTGQSFLAALLLALFCFFIAWRVRRTHGPSEPKRRYATIALAAVILTMLSFVTPPHPHTKAPADSAAGGRGGHDDYFSGVVLLAPPKPHPVRVPVLDRTPIRGGRASVSPLTIPFTGEYWFFYWPLPRPPQSALIEHGSPTSFTFTSTDVSPLAMQAHQELAELIDLRSFRRLDVFVQNKDPQPGTIELELVLQDFSKPKSSQSLGYQPLRRQPTALHYPIPVAPTIQAFDRIVVWFRLDPSRNRRSAQIDIDHFELIP